MYLIEQCTGTICRKVAPIEMVIHKLLFCSPDGNRGQRGGERRHPAIALQFVVDDVGDGEMRATVNADVADGVIQRLCRRWHNWQHQQGQSNQKFLHDYPSSKCSVVWHS